MSQIKVVSFDAEGTLVTHDFSQAIWHEAIPACYAQKKEIDPVEAKRIVVEEYDKIGDKRLEWYDIEYWFRYFDLGASKPVIQSCQDKISHYPEVTEVLSSLIGKYKLVVASGTPMELLDYLLQELRPHFLHVFSSISQYRQLKTPSFYLEMCRAMNVEPSEVIHVGDSWQIDFLNSGQVGIRAFYLDRSGKNHQESLSDLTQLKHLLLSPE